MAKKLKWQGWPKVAKDRREFTEGHRQLVEAALDLTRLKMPMRRACILVLVYGMRKSKAAALVGKPKQFVYRAMLILSPKLAEVKREVA